MDLVQIVPHLPPTLSGVGDYAFLLAQELRRSHDIHTRFVVCDPSWEEGPAPADASTEGRSPTREVVSAPQRSSVSAVGSPRSLDGFPVHRLRTRTSDELLRLLSAPGMPSTVLLQYVGYGYEKRGCPLWLVNGLEKWRRQQPASTGANPERRQAAKLKAAAADNEAVAQAASSQGNVSALRFSAGRRVVTMFHELYAFGPPWTSAFWTSALQRSLVRRLALVSAHALTNLTLRARTLSRMTRRSEKAFPVLPVFSNVGEPRVLPTFTERPKRLAVFGSAGWRELAYRRHQDALEQACRRLGLEEIVDIGPPLREPPQTSVPCKQRGLLAAAKVSEELAACRAGFFTCPVHCLGKSGVFAAYAAHGLAALTSNDAELENADGLRAGEHFARAEAPTLAQAEQCARIAQNIAHWYAGHRLRNQAGMYAEVIASTHSGPPRA